MKTEYWTDEYSAYQTLEIEINEGQERVFYYFGTSEGSKQWFPELTFEDEARPEKLLLELGDGTHDHMYILDLIERKRLVFTWSAGDVRIEIVEADGDKTLVRFQERLPAALGNIVEDFAGWYFQLENLKHIAETGELQEVGEDALEERKKKVKEELGL